MSKKAFICLAVVALFATTAMANPITLPTGQTAKLKFTNFENFIDNGDGVIDGNMVNGVHDRVEGILLTTSIGTITQPSLYSAQITGPKELTGHFELSIVGGTLSGPFPQHLDFAILAGDFINIYVDTTPDWSVSPASSRLNDIANATDGALWASITSAAPGFYQGVGDTTSPASGDTVNTNFADFSVNNSGYNFIPQLFGGLQSDPTAHKYLGTDYADVKAETFFKSRLFFANAQFETAAWAFRSEDPMYLWAVPEPGTFVLLGAGVVGLGLLRLRRRRK